MKTFVQPGDTVTVAAPADVDSGDLVKVGMLVGVAVHDADSGDDVEITTSGVFELAKVSAQAWTVGAAIYMVPASGLATTATTAGNVFIGVAAAVADNPSGTGLVRLNGSMPSAATV